MPLGHGCSSSHVQQQQQLWWALCSWCGSCSPLPLYQQQQQQYQHRLWQHGSFFLYVLYRRGGTTGLKLWHQLFQVRAAVGKAAP